MTDSRYSKQTKKQANKQTLHTGLKTRKQIQSKCIQVKSLRSGPTNLDLCAFFVEKNIEYIIFLYIHDRKKMKINTFLLGIRIQKYYTIYIMCI